MKWEEWVSAMLGQLFFTALSVMGNSLRLDFYLGEGLAIVDALTLPTALGRMVMIHRCVFTTWGFSLGGASFLAFAQAPQSRGLLPS